MARKPDKSAPTTKAADGKGASDDAFKEALKRWQYAYERERENIDLAYEDQLFRMGEQWDPQTLQQRLADARPAMTFNRLPQFIKQVTGDIRQMRPGVKVVPIDDRADDKVADLLAGMVRYIEGRSDANKAYFQAADNQVSCGVGHWRVVTEYADDSTFEQEIGVELIEDQIAVLWDPDATHPTRRDARYCFVPVDMSRELFKETYPDATASGVAVIGSLNYPTGWAGDDFIRVAEYWVKKRIKRKLAMMPGGGLDDLTDDPDAAEKEAQIKAAGGRVEMRDGYQVVRYVISGTEILEGPEQWPGRFIPIVPVIGEEVRAGRRRYRHGLVRFAKDAQRAYNYFRSTQTEVVALQPKAPWIGTIDHFKDNLDMWETANQKNWPFLAYTIDPKNPGSMPQRVAPPVSSQGMVEGVNFAAEDMKAVIGIYDASLGAKSNETSGRAIMARQREGDNATFVYIDNFTLAVQHTGRIIVDLIPHIYDTERMIRVVGEDGAIDVVPINKPASEAVDGIATILNDVTVGAYDVSLEMGPSYTTKRAEARDGMQQLIQSVPQTFPLIGDLFVKAQDWPMADKIADRLRTTLPPQIAMKEAAEAGEPPPPPPPPPPPDPKVEAETMKAQADVQLKAIDLQIAQIKLAMEEAKAAAAMQPGLDMQAFAQQLSMLQHAMDMITSHVTGDFEAQEPPAMEMAEHAGPVPMEPPDEIGPMPPQGAEMMEPQEPPQGGFFNGSETP